LINHRRREGCAYRNLKTAVGNVVPELGNALVGRTLQPRNSVTKYAFLAPVTTPRFCNERLISQIFTGLSRYVNREILHAEVTRHPTAHWAAQQIVGCCAWDRAPPRILTHDRDSRFGAGFDRGVRYLGIRQVCTPFRSRRADAVAERRVISVRSECLDRLFVFSEHNLCRSLSAYVT